MIQGARTDLAVDGGGWSLRDLAVEAFYNQRIILICLCAGVVAGLAGLALARTEYTADSRILIRAAAEPAPHEGLSGPAMPLAGDAVQRIVQADIEVIASDPVLEAALVRLHETATPRDIERLRRQLHVSAEPNSSLIRVSLTATDRTRAMWTLAALLDAYAAHRAVLYRSGPALRQDTLLRASEMEIARLTDAISAIRARNGVLDIAQSVQLATAGLDALDQRLDQAREHEQAATAERAAAASELARTPERVFERREVTNATPNDEGHNTLLRLRQERAHMASQYAADWPGLVELDRKITAAETEVAANALDTRHSDHTARNPVLDQLAARRAALDLDLAALARQIGVMSREKAAAEAHVTLLQGIDAQLHDLERQRAVEEGIQRQLAVSQAATQLADAAVSDGEAALRIVQPPSAPIHGKSLGATYLLAGVLAGAAGALAASCCASVLRQRYITPREAERALGLPALSETEASGIEIGRRAGADAVTSLATLLTDIRLGANPLGVVQIVGADPAAKAALALALGQALAHRGGQPILIVDIESEDGYRGLAPVKASRDIALGQSQLGVARSAMPGLWITTRTGGTPLAALDAPAAALKACIGLLRQSFRLVILVAPHAFADYPARRLYGLADANVLLIDSAHTRPPTAQRMREVVLAAGGDLLGFVFTSRRRYIPEPLLKWL